MKLYVPTIKNQEFSNTFFSSLSDGIITLKEETGKWPDILQLSGALGKELHSFIIEKGWDLNKFGLTLHSSIVNKIYIAYSKPLNQIESDIGKTIFDESLHERKINGIVSDNTMDKIISAYSSFSFTIERTIRPSYEIRLFRK